MCVDTCLFFFNENYIQKFYAARWVAFFILGGTDYEEKSSQCCIRFYVVWFIIFAGFGLYGVVSAHESAEVYYEQSQGSAYSGSIDDKAQVSADEEQVFVPEIGEAAEEVIGEGEN